MHAIAQLAVGGSEVKSSGPSRKIRLPGDSHEFELSVCIGPRVYFMMTTPWGQPQAALLGLPLTAMHTLRCIMFHV